MNIVKLAPKRRVAMLRTLCFALSTALLVTGCARPDIEGLDTQLDALRDRPQGHVDALPEQPSYQAAAYSHADLRGPFTPWASVSDMLPATEEAGAKPDAQRSKDPLEAYALDALRFAGTLFSNGRAVALIQTPDGSVQRLHVGQHLGEHAGRVVAIENNRLAIVELVADGSGGWQEQPRELTMGEANAP
ncbi:pilus assembly protein PilP [Phytohalomonas tamaricis]|uniref:pilus assembly protein PilP n=1 Tax=Phytohalomonas tamaricis TaxID=2081032 RepID=UPI000D0B88BD|nr:pilus assembly protein PilP [Phytohalomonas tamaricis]